MSDPVYKELRRVLAEHRQAVERERVPYWESRARLERVIYEIHKRADELPLGAEGPKTARQLRRKIWDDLTATVERGERALMAVGAVDRELKALEVALRKTIIDMEAW